MAFIGNALTSPENGWTRFDNRNNLIKYIGNLFEHDNAHSYSYNKSLSYIPAGNLPSDILTHKIEFSFIGTKLRIMGVKYLDYSKQFSVTVDGEEQVTSLYNSSSSAQYQILLCEFSNLPNRAHKVEIKSLDGIRYALDCIDIDEDGYLCDERVVIETVSHTKAFYAQTVPMNTTKKILAKINDTRVGLLGIANDDENFGDAYVVGKDGMSHLIKAATKKEIIFEGSANQAKTSYTLNDSIEKFSYIIVTGCCSDSIGNKLYSLETVVSKENYDYESASSTYAICGVSYANGANGYTIGFRFNDDKTLFVNSITNTMSNWIDIRITRITGVY